MSGERAPARQPSREEVAGLTALDLFAMRLARGPARPMLHLGERTITAGDVDALSDAFAGALHERGVRHGDRVALMLQNDPQFPICQIGAWKAGAAVVPVNPMLQRGELTALLADADCRVLVCLDELAADAVPAAAAAGLAWTASTAAGDITLPSDVAGAQALSDWLAAAGPAPTGDAVRLAPDDIAVLTYTSGTTGASKGACNTHANVVWSAHVFRDWVDLDEDTVILAAAPLFHVTGQVGHLAVGDLLGAPLILTHRFDARLVLEAAERWGATFLVAAVTAYHALLAASDRAPATLRRLVSGAQPIPPALVEEVERWSGGCYLQNMYGMTETTSPSHAVPPGQRAPVHQGSGALSVGVAVTGTDCVILDPETLDVLGAGAEGEIAVRGPQVVPGYWRRPEATEAAFHDGWLRSGDLGLIDEHGWCFVLDRIKDLINAGGFKVVPREVEDVLYEHPAVRAAAVVGVPDPYRGETVKAFVVVREGAVYDPDALAAHCRERLAAYKRPRQIEVVDDLPRTVSGKVLRRALRAASSDQPTGTVS